MKSNRTHPPTKPKSPTVLEPREGYRVDTQSYPDHFAAAIHESMADLVDLGAVELAALREVENSLLAGGATYTGEQVRSIREREKASQTVFAHYLGVSVNTVSQWERSQRRVTGAAATLLRLVEQYGLAHIR